MRVRVTWGFGLPYMQLKHAAALYRSHGARHALDAQELITKLVAFDTTRRDRYP